MRLKLLPACFQSYMMHILPHILASEMKIHLSADYESEIWFYPVYASNGHLIAVELVSQFVHESAPVTLPQLDKEQQLRLLQSQISLLEQHRSIFEEQGILALMRINHQLSVRILESEFLTRKIKQLPFLLLDLSETFPHLAQGIHNPLLATLHREFRLSLSQFGAGNSPANAVYDNVFSCIKLDKYFIQELAKRDSFQPFIQSILDNFRSHCEHMIICGVDDELLLNKINKLSGVHLQGELFPVAKSDALEALIYANTHSPTSQLPQ